MAEKIFVEQSDTNIDTNIDTNDQTIEELLSNCTFAKKSHGGGTPTVNNVGFIVQALEQLRGVQRCNRIVKVAGTLRQYKYPNQQIPKEFASAIRGELQTHSSDSGSYNGKDDYFSHPERGYWGLRPGVHTDADGNVVVDQL